jgi:putative transposase
VVLVGRDFSVNQNLSTPFTLMETTAKRYYERRLPHWHPEGAIIFLTSRLWGSLPPSAIERIKARRSLLQREAARNGETARERGVRHSKQVFANMDEMLDKAEHGPVCLKQPFIADLVEDSLLHRCEHLYSLWADVVIANHIHVLFQPKKASSSGYVAMEEITRRLKGSTARAANQFLNRTGQSFWQDESYDHWVRDEAEFYRVIAYLESNPVKAGLVARPEEWQWSSARERVRRGFTEARALT